ncbi:hypothetical protein BpHYR1_014200 [Brachionus plicatilis]|uniref:Uncharacterized protein n=1 Tax=Brachionus plicatilis TaxID=10195 RepID=A0A3M7S9M3_BRAPC|nr:hypothetical protein BpHYR1_014200 [Brachionus plicatilis]
MVTLKTQYILSIINKKWPDLVLTNFYILLKLKIDSNELFDPFREKYRTKIPNFEYFFNRLILINDKICAMKK